MGQSAERTIKQPFKTLNLAKISQLKEIMRAFASWRTIFPHVRQDYIKRKIAAKECVYEQGVIITFNKYKVKVKLGTVSIPAGSYMIHQIVNSKQGNGKGSVVIDRFCELAARDNQDVYLAVRKDNELARMFYKRKGFQQVGTVDWSGGKLPGIIYKKPLAKHIIDML